MSAYRRLPATDVTIGSGGRGPVKDVHPPRVQRQTHAVSVVNINSDFVGGVPTRLSTPRPTSSSGGARVSSAVSRCSDDMVSWSSSPAPSQKQQYRPTSITFPQRSSAYLTQQACMASLNRGKLFFQEHPEVADCPRTSIPSHRVPATVCSNTELAGAVPADRECSVKRIDGIDWLADYKRNRNSMTTSSSSSSYPKMVAFVRAQRAQPNPHGQQQRRDPIEAWAPLSTTVSAASNSSVHNSNTPRSSRQQQQHYHARSSSSRVDSAAAAAAGAGAAIVPPDAHDPCPVRPITNTPATSEDEDGWSLSEDEGIELAEEDEDKVCYGGSDYSHDTGHLLRYYLRQERGEELQQQRGRGRCGGRPGHKGAGGRSSHSASGPGHVPHILIPTARQQHQHPPEHRPITACSHLVPPTPPPQSPKYTRVGGYYIGRRLDSHPTRNATGTIGRVSSYVQIHRPLTMADKPGQHGGLLHRAGSPGGAGGRQPISVPAVTFQNTQSLAGVGCGGGRGGGAESIVLGRSNTANRPMTSHLRRGRTTPSASHSVT